MLLAIITAWLAYKKANENGRNGILWAVIGAAVFIGTQLVVAVGFGLFLGLGQGLWGWPDSMYEDYTWPITIVAIVASFGASWLLLKYLDRVPESDSFPEPPPPPSFGDPA